MKTKLFYSIAILIAVTQLGHTQTTLPYFPQQKNFGGEKVINLQDFVYTTLDFTLEVSAVANNEITVGEDVFSYTPNTNGLVRFVQKNKSVYVFENGVYQVTLTPQITPGSNLLVNTGFESNGGQQTKASDWTTYKADKTDGGTDAGSARNTTKYSGSFSFLIRNVGQYLVQSVSGLKANSTYEFSYWYRTNETAQGGASYKIELGSTAFGAESASVDAHTTVKTDLNWRQFVGVITTNATIPSYFCLHRTNIGNFFDYYDDMVLREIPIKKGITGVGTAVYLEENAIAPVIVDFENNDRMDMTELIINASFENSTMSGDAPFGWSQTVGASSSRSTTQVGDGSVVGTTNWQIWELSNSGKAYQMLEGLPIGRYLLKAGVYAKADTKVEEVNLFANAENTPIVLSEDANWYELEVIVTNGQLEIGLDILKGSGGAPNIKLDNVSLYAINIDIEDVKDIFEENLEKARAALLIADSNHDFFNYDELDELVELAETIDIDTAIKGDLLEVIALLSNAKKSFDELNIEYNKRGLSTLKAGGETIQLIQEHYSYYFGLNSVASIPAITASANAGGIEPIITQATTIPGFAEITVSSHSGITDMYRVYMGRNKMENWEGDGQSSPTTFGWDVNEEASVTWDGNNNRYRTNIGSPVNNGTDAVLYVTNTDVIYSYPFDQLDKNKMYAFTAKIWRRDGGNGAIMNTSVKIDTNRNGSGNPISVLDQSIIGNNAVQDVSDRFSSYVTIANPYFLWSVENTSGIWENAAIWKINIFEIGDLYEVVFDTDGGSTVDAQYFFEHESGKVTEPETDPVKDGHVFKGWYEEADGNTTYDFGKQVTSDLVIYAQWEEDVNTDTSVDTYKTVLKIMPAVNGINIRCTDKQTINIYALSGQIIQHLTISPGDNFVTLPKGVYFVNHSKVIVQ